MKFTINKHVIEKTFESNIFKTSTRVECRIIPEKVRKTTKESEYTLSIAIVAYKIVSPIINRLPTLSKK